MSTFFACLFYAIFCIMILEGALLFILRMKLFSLGISLELLAGRKLAEMLESGIVRHGILTAIFYLLYLFCWYV